MFLQNQGDTTDASGFIGTTDGFGNWTNKKGVFIKSEDFRPGSAYQNLTNAQTDDGWYWVLWTNDLGYDQCKAERIVSDDTINGQSIRF